MCFQSYGAVMIKKHMLWSYISWKHVCANEYKWASQRSAVWNDKHSVKSRLPSRMNKHSHSWIPMITRLPLLPMHVCQPSLPPLFIHYAYHDYDRVWCSLHCRWSAVSSEWRVREQLQLLPLSRWLDLMILSEYSDILEHSIWQGKKEKKKLINWP